MDSRALPIREYANKIVQAVKNNPVTIVIGETGSGKTTQISQVNFVGKHGQLMKWVHDVLVLPWLLTDSVCIDP